MWSVEIFESIVAFKINRKATELKSEPLWNIKPNQKPKDYRNADQIFLDENQIEISSSIDKAFSIYKDD